MAQRVKRLSDRTVQAGKAKGLYADGGGLYLQVSASRSKSWIFRFKRNGRARDMGLGSYPTVALTEARKLAAGARRLHEQGKDPIAERDAQRAQERLARASSTTFQDCAEQLIASHEAGWRNAKHRAQWRSTLATYAYPVLGGLPVAAVDTGMVMKVLEPIWKTKTETASRVRGRIEAVLSWAKARGMRAGENPAQWRGHLDHLLPARSKVRRVVHYPALPYEDLPAFMARLRARGGITARALEFTILTAARTGEAVGARFDEIDMKAGLWTVPADRMKAGKPHRVPLSPRVLAIVKEMAALRLNDFIFPGAKRDKPLSDMALLMLLRDLHPGVTVHGFRSSFKDWAAECTHAPNFVSEAALAHGVSDKVEAAYRRGDLMDRRGELMDAWAAYCEPQKGTRRNKHPLRGPDAAGSTRSRRKLPTPEPIPRRVAVEIR